MFLDLKIKNIYVFFLSVIIVFPFNALYGINVKVIALGLLVSSLFFVINVLEEILFKIFYFLFFILCCFLYSILNGETYLEWIYKQSFDIITSYIVFLLISVYAFRRNCFEFFLEKISLLLSLAAVVKLLVMWVAIKKNMLMSDFVEAYNLNYLTLDMQDSIIQRLTSQMDAVLPIVLLYLLLKGDDSGFLKKDYLIILLLIFSIIISMSRYIWLASFITILIYILKARNVARNILYIFVFIGLVVIFYFSQIFSTIFEIRGDQNTNTASDGVRIFQKTGIYNSISEQPFLGHGLGYYLPNIIRGDHAKYLYELQIPALVMQIGFIGFIIYMIFIVYPFINISNRISTFNKVLLFLLFIIWLGNAFVNPYLFSAPGGVALASILLLANSKYFKLRGK